MSGDELWSLYGNIGNHRVVALRTLCRARLVGIDPYAIRANLERSRRDASNTADSIRELGGSEQAAARADKIANVLEYWRQRPEDLRQMILSRYSKEIEGADGDVATSGYNGEKNRCPYEKNPDKRSCWGCHVPVKIWDQMEAQYDREK